MNRDNKIKLMIGVMIFLIILVGIILNSYNVISVAIVVIIISLILKTEKFKYHLVVILMLLFIFATFLY